MDMTVHPETPGCSFSLLDTPTEDNPAHCEIDVTPLFPQFPTERRTLIKGFLARAYRVLIPPTT